MNLIKSTDISLENTGEYIVVKIFNYSDNKTTTHRYPTSEYTIEDVVKFYKENK